MAKMEEVLEQAKQEYLKTPLDDISCSWCGDKAVRDLGEVKGFSFVECTNCGFAFCPYISQDFMDRLYGNGYHSNEEGVPEHGWSRIEFMEPVLKLFKQDEPLAILDFGCGQSKVPARLREKGHRVIGVDVTKPVHPHPDRLTGNILDLNLAPEQFDITYSFQVFEHLPDPVPLFNELLRLTKPNGYILIHTDMEPPEREEGFQQWWYVLPPDHCSLYRIKSFRKILESSPHVLVEENPVYVIIQKK